MFYRVFQDAPEDAPGIDEVLKITCSQEANAIVLS
jgi:hypothetical protein